MRLGCWGPRICFFNLKFIETEQCEAAYSFIIARLSIHNKSGRSSDAKEQLNESRLSSVFLDSHSPLQPVARARRSRSGSMKMRSICLVGLADVKWRLFKVSFRVFSVFVFVLTVFPCSPHASLRVDILWSEKRNNEAFSASFLLSHWKKFSFWAAQEITNKKKMFENT